MRLSEGFACMHRIGIACVVLLSACWVFPSTTHLFVTLPYRHFARGLSGVSNIDDLRNILSCSCVLQGFHAAACRGPVDALLPEMSVFAA